MVLYVVSILIMIFFSVFPVYNSVFVGFFTLLMQSFVFFHLGQETEIHPWLARLILISHYFLHKRSFFLLLLGFVSLCTFCNDITIWLLIPGWVYGWGRTGEDCSQYEHGPTQFHQCKDLSCYIQSWNHCHRNLFINHLIDMWTNDRGILGGSFLRFLQRCLYGLQWHWKGEENAPSGLRSGCLLVRPKMHM